MGGDLDYEMEDKSHHQHHSHGKGGIGISASELDEFNAINDTEQLHGALEDLGGVPGLAKLLASDVDDGIDVDVTVFEQRKTEFGRNTYTRSKPKSIFKLWFEAWQDEMLIILTVAAFVSLFLGLAFPPEDETRATSWIDGAAILAAVVIVCTVAAVNDWSQDRQFRELNEKKDDTLVSVLRAGQRIQVSIHDVLVGDVCFLSTGDQIPADGIYIRGQNCYVNESNMNGEPIPAAKSEEEPKLSSGCQLTDGNCYMIVTAVGDSSKWGKVLRTFTTDFEETPLQDKLSELARNIGYVGLAVAVVVFFISMVYWIVDVSLNLPFEWVSLVDILGFFIIAITIVVVAVPEGLPLAVTIALAYSMKKMTKDQNLVRRLKACETMGGATTICSDKTGTLTQNRMTVVKGWISSVPFSDPLQHTIQSDFVRALVTETISLNSTADLEDPALKDILVNIPPPEIPAYTDWTDKRVSLPKKKPLVKRSQVYHHRSNPSSSAPSAVMTDPRTGVTSSSSSSSSSSSKYSYDLDSDYDGRGFDNSGRGGFEEDELRSNNNAQLAPVVSQFPEFDFSKASFVGSPTECALLVYLKRIGEDYRILRKHGPPIVKQFPFSSARKRMSTVVRTEGGGFRLYCNGASEIVLARCNSFLNPEGYSFPLDLSLRSELETFIQQMAGNGLRTLALAYREFQHFDTSKDHLNEEDEPPETGLTLIALVGIEDPVRPEVPNAVKQCQNAGITVRMVTGDNILTASKIAQECGIFNPETGIALEGPEFARMSDEDVIAALPRLQVLARSQPDDKLRLVKLLKQTKNLVAVTGDGTNDAPALREAHVGCAMGSGTAVAKEASDIIIMDDNFNSIVKSVMWGRCIFDNIRKFLQFQLTVNVTAMAISYLGVLIKSGPPLRAVQLLWVNLIMDSFGALALATEPPTPELLNRSPINVAHPKTRLISNQMWKCIIGQSIYQVGVLLVLLYLGPTLFGVESNSDRHFTIIFNAFVWCQIFNEINARKINGEFNVFAGFFSNYMFLGILVFTAIVQAAIVQIDILNWVFKTEALNIIEWAACILIGAFSILLGFFLRVIPVPSSDTYYGGEETEEGESAEEESTTEVDLK
eukprot:TRINITY_DN243_c1_g1_i4.p1 TRINITY_DN243_c1_g1~~TRINITY_DN243_c1_g1_i4.p1  ORF type:complete len:1139 (+),score=611.29 TRINITY_DN243_c1_g1_i4:107-3418(+)